MPPSNPLTPCISVDFTVTQRPYPFPSYPETLSKRQATQHGCLPSLLGDRNNGIEIVYGDEITINVPVVYMGRYEVVLRGDYP
jgi:hypothetical protein